jgi:UDP-N-acetylmuramate--alanine ligase
MIHLDSVKTIHIVGIKGAGTSALACILKKQGKAVCGSDCEEEFFTDALLRSCGIPCERFSDRHIGEAPLDMVMYSTVWKDSCEVRAARAKGIPLLSYPQALGLVFDAGFGVAIAGSHGKTTTTGMLAHVLKQAGLDPTAVVGSSMVQYDSNAFFGHSPTIVIEADEYENKFQYYHPRALLVTNIDYDHPDYFTNPAQYDDVFKTFIQKTIASQGTVVLCGDDEGVRRVQESIAHNRTVLYGTDISFPYVVSDVRTDGPSMRYTLVVHGKPAGRYTLQLLGSHNVLNALGVIALADTLGLVDATRTAQLLEQFRGTARRFEYKGTKGAMLVYDDFAHHPREVRVTLDAVRNAFPGKRIWCAFGSHTFSRTKALLQDFGTSFGGVDRALILDIYGSREQQGTVHGQDVAATINAVSHNAQYVGSHENARREIVDHIDEIDVLITMGAGDVWQIAEKLVRHPY